MNMIENVAKAIARHQLTALGKAAMDKPNSDYYNKCFSKAERTNIESIARAAIEAMREPTEEMINVEGTFYKIKDHYQAMIDAALKE